jgi:quinoprotein glucose dehydrogenase
MKSSGKKTAPGFFMIATTVAIAFACSFAAAQQGHKSWSDYGGGADNSRFTALEQIKKSNVKQLGVAWTYFNGQSAMNPIIAHGVMYVYGRNNSLIALDAATGKEIWIHTGLSTIAELGVNYWESKDGKDRRLIFQINHFLEEIDARTGKSILSFGEDGLVDMREGLDRVPAEVARIKSDAPGRVFENLIIEGSSTGENFLAPPGHIRAYDVITGKVVWTFHTVPYPGEFGYDTWPKDAWRYIGGVNDWGELSLDEKRGIVYVVLGSPTYDLYGADRIGMGLFGDSLVALDARTGKRLWHFQEVHHDLWDSDPCSAPQLITVRHNGQLVDAVAQAGKTGFVYVFNRVTGEPLWPIEERPVPQSDVPGEQAWPTQPFPTAPPPFARQKMSADDVNPFLLTPEERATWKEKIASARNEGLFTPAGYMRDTVQIPGSRGGSNRGTSASDPEKGLFFVTSSDFPSLINIQGPELPVTTGAAGGRGPGGVAAPAEYQQNCQSCHGADLAGSVEVPPLAGVTSRLTLPEFRMIVASGKGQMPAHPDLDAAAVDTLYNYLASASGGGAAAESRPMTGPVVANGGAPGGLLPAPLNPRRLTALYGGNNRFVGPPYPDGIVAPQRLYSNYGLVTGVIGPPWSEIICYDLNTGTIRWRKPLGEDEEAVKEGGKNTGMLAGGERVGMVVTSTGLVFATAKDGKMRAFDVDNGDELWTYKMPAGLTGLPSVYEAQGREYLVVGSGAPPVFGLKKGARGFGENVPAADQATLGYVVFALPGNPRRPGKNAATRTLRGS